MTGPTLGPWRVKPESSNVIGCRTIQGPKLGSHKQAQHTDLAYTVGLRNDVLDKANANLLAAAPELLEALEDAVRGFEWLISTYPEQFNEADNEKIVEWKAAIAKATREAS